MPLAPEAPAQAAPSAQPPGANAPISVPISPDRSGSMKRSLGNLKNLASETPKPEPETPKAPPSPPVESKAAVPKDDKPLAEAKSPSDPAKVEPAAKVDDASKAEAPKVGDAKDWPLFNRIKSENATLKRQLAEKLKATDDAEKRELSEKLTTHQKELETERKARKEYEDLIRFRDYQNHPEFIKEYVQPWEEAWREAESNLKGLQMVEDSGEERAITKADIQALSEMEIDVARAAIKKLVPDTSDAAELKGYVDKVRQLTKRHKAALEKAWVDSEKWQKDLQLKQQQEYDNRNQSFKKVSEENSALFNKFNEEDTQKIEHLREKEGDDEWNERLKSAKEFAKESLSGNPNNPELTSEDRAKMIRRNTAFINRSIAYPMLKLELNRVKAQLAEKDKVLSGYKASEPTPGNGKGKSAPSTVPANAMEASKHRLRQYVT